MHVLLTWFDSFLLRNYFNRTGPAQSNNYTFVFQAQAPDGYLGCLNYVGRWVVLVGERMGTSVWSVHLWGGPSPPSLQQRFPSEAGSTWPRRRFTPPILALGIESQHRSPSLGPLWVWGSGMESLPQMALLPVHDSHTFLCLPSHSCAPFVFPLPRSGV